MSQRVRGGTVQVTVRRILRLDNEYSGLPRIGPPQFTVEVLARDSTIVGISALILPAWRGIMGAPRLGSLSNSRTRPRLEIRPMGRRTRASQRLLLGARAGREFTPVGRLLVHPIDVPQSFLIFRGVRAGYHRIPSASIPLGNRLGRLTPDTRQLYQLTGGRIETLVTSTPRSITPVVVGDDSVHDLVLLRPSPPNRHLTAPPEPCGPRPMETGLVMLTSIRLSKSF